MASPDKFYEAAQATEDALVDMIRDALNAEYILRGQKATPDNDPPLQRARLLQQAKNDMQRLLNMIKVVFP